MDEFPNLPSKRYQQLRHEIKSGDILLCSGNATFSNMIKQATKSPWSHVAFILRLDFIDRIIVLESVESIGVRAVPLSSYVFDYNTTGKGYAGRLMLARHRDLKQENIVNLSKIAMDLLGYPYHTEEILRIAARIGMNTIGLNRLAQDVLPQREFICSEYAHICFKSVGITIDYNSLGFIAPADFARCPHVDALSFVQTEEMRALHALLEPTKTV
ncbi:MAG: hypothetical protein ACD_45C00597G0002 [uncultured bacterium]|nr:MAG: hypothetical protein ACD_45C00597G0002 [uncultured bacterium]